MLEMAGEMAGQVVLALMPPVGLVVIPVMVVNMTHVQIPLAVRVLAVAVAVVVWGSIIVASLQGVAAAG